MSTISVQEAYEMLKTENGQRTLESAVARLTGWSRLPDGQWVRQGTFLGGPEPPPFLRVEESDELACWWGDKLHRQLWHVLPSYRPWDWHLYVLDVDHPSPRCVLLRPGADQPTVHVCGKSAAEVMVLALAACGLLAKED